MTTREAEDVEADRRALLAAFLEEELVGTVQVALAQQPNSPHRAEIGQLLVRRSARRRGIARRLMEHAEREARARRSSSPSPVTPPSACTSAWAGRESA